MTVSRELILPVAGECLRAWKLSPLSSCKASEQDQPARRGQENVSQLAGAGCKWDRGQCRPACQCQLGMRVRLTDTNTSS